MHQLLLIQTFRPDRLLAMAHQYVDKVLGTQFLQRAEQELNLADSVENEVFF